VLGASGWQTFWRVTLPNIKWGLLYGVILCNARAMGEFGAVSVVSGHIRGQTNTMPLHIEILYNEYQFAAAFAVASLLALLALVTLVLKYGGRMQRRRTEAGPCTARECTPPGERDERMSIEVRNISKRFGDQALRQCQNLDIPAGELVALLGPRAAARPRCCASSPGWNGRTGQRCSSTAKTPPTPTCASATSASCSSTTRCSAT
jgi:hypothetical protein